MNPFDTAIYLFGLFAMVTGFNSGLLRSLATILAYAVAAPAALVFSPRVADFMTGRGWLPSDLTAYVPFVVLILLGFVLGAAMRSAVAGLTGGHTVFIDRLLGAVLGTVRVFFVAVLLVLIFKSIVPPGREPSWYAESKLRPFLAVAGEQGLRSLPPQVTDYIEKLKRERGL